MISSRYRPPVGSASTVFAHGQQPTQNAPAPGRYGTCRIWGWPPQRSHRRPPVSSTIMQLPVDVIRELYSAALRLRLFTSIQA